MRRILTTLALLVVVVCLSTIPLILQNSTVNAADTITVTVKLLDSNNVGISGQPVQYYSGGWQTFGTTDGSGAATKDLPSGTYSFGVNYVGARQEKSQNIGTDPLVVFQTNLVTMKLLNSGGSTELSGTAQYYASGWKTFGGGTTTTTMELLPGTYSFGVNYVGARQEKSQNIGTTATEVDFQTTSVTMKLRKSDGITDLSADLAQYYANGWKTFGGGSTPSTMELLPGNYSFGVNYIGARQEKSQNIGTTATEVDFQTTSVTMKLLDGDNNQINADLAQYYANGWKTFGTGSTTSTMELLPVNYSFGVNYGGSRLEKSQNVNQDPVVIFNGTNVTLQFTGDIQYYANGWKTFTKPTMTLLPGNYTFQFSGNTYPATQINIQVTGSDMEDSIAYIRLINHSGAGISGGTSQDYVSGWQNIPGTTNSQGVIIAIIPGLKSTLSFSMNYAGARQEMSQNIASNSFVLFQTKVVTMKLLDSVGTTDLHGTSQYYASGWKTFGTGTTETTMELLPGTYSFGVNYAGARQEKSQNITTDPVVLFQTKVVTMKLLDSVGATDLHGTSQYYASGWKTFGTGTTETTMELLPGTYSFGVNYAGARQEKSQNIGTDPLVVFQTTKVTLWFTGDIQYYAGGWKNFVKPSTELLSGNYPFSFGDASHPTIQTNISVYGTTLEKTIAYVRVLKSNGQGQSGVTPTKWWDYGSGTTTISDPTNGNGALLISMDGKHTNTNVQVFWYSAGSQLIFKNIATVSSFFDFQLYKATVQMIDNAGGLISSATPDVYFHAYGASEFLIGPMSGGKLNIDLLPGTTYFFDIKSYSFNGSQGTVSAVLNTNPQIFSFQTGKVTQGTASCTSYHLYGGGEKTFSEPMQLLPGTYYFKMSTGSTLTYTVKAGQTLDLSTGNYTSP
jgi:hypothetical protein